MYKRQATTRATASWSSPSVAVSSGSSLLASATSGSSAAGAVGAGESADILMITSIAGHVVYEGGGGYVAAKFAEHAMTAGVRPGHAGEANRRVGGGAGDGFQGGGGQGARPAAVTRVGVCRSPDAH